MNAECPSCGAALEKMPTRKTKCRACGEFMFVKHTPVDPVRRLVTATRAAEIEHEWAARASRLAIDETATSMGLAMGLTEQELHQALSAFVYDERDRNRAKLAAVYLAKMAGNPPQRAQWMRWVFAHELKRIEEMGYRTVVIHAGRDGCPSCNDVGGTLLPIQDALQQMVPNPNCANWPERSTCCAFWAADLSDNPYGLKRNIS